ncbi:DUF6083 domain-containing protein [Streptomyces sp. NPDC004111]|uniref:DUF6083 domain-containing protein n=1 Tax=Streptomyces sp. NPDC004111 TaxID=3364690 RepID=UPI00368B2DCD
MYPTPTPRRRPNCTALRARRTLRVPATSPSQVLRSHSNGPCPRCGHRIEWHPRADHSLLVLHPAEFTTTVVPADWRWELSCGIAHPHGDATPWCRIPHAILCPAHTPDPHLTPHLTEVRRHLAVRTRILLDTGRLTPLPPTAPCPPTADLPHTPATAPGAPPC